MRASGFPGTAINCFSCIDPCSEAEGRIQEVKTTTFGLGPQRPRFRLQNLQLFKRLSHFRRFLHLIHFFRWTRARRPKGRIQETRNNRIWLRAPAALIPIAKPISFLEVIIFPTFSAHYVLFRRWTRARRPKGRIQETMNNRMRGRKRRATVPPRAPGPPVPL